MALVRTDPLRFAGPARPKVFLKRQPKCAMESCGSSHYRGRETAKPGHEVKPQRQKNDATDAEAAARPMIVAVKEQQGWRSLFGRQRTTLRGHLAEFGLVAPQGPADAPRPAKAIPWRSSACGVERLEAIAEGNPSSRQGFVAMWFDASTSDAYDHGIKLGIEDADYEARRIDEKEHNNKIDDEVIAETRRSRFVVADFTCGTVPYDGKDVAVPRGGVYCEAGFAQGLNIPAIWTCREDRQAHFDARQYSRILWTGSQDLRRKLRNRIGTAIGSVAVAPRRSRPDPETGIDRPVVRCRDERRRQEFRNPDGKPGSCALFSR